VPTVVKLPPVIVPVALTVPPVAKLPPVILAADVIVDVADINPPVKTLPPVMLPVALAVPPVAKLPPVTVPLTDKLVSVPTVVKLENNTFELKVLPVKLFASTLLAVTPVSCEPLPIKNDPVLAVILPAALTCPAVVMLPPTTLAVALSVVLEITFAPEMLPPDPLVLMLPNVPLPVAEINPPVRILPPVMLPVALAVPPVAKLPPVIVAAEVIVDVAEINPPVSKLPPVMLAALVIVDVAEINPPVRTLPPVTLPDALKTPVIYSPVVANTATFDVPPIPMATLPPELTTRTFEFPLWILVASIPVS
jgi:hypothetical protein